MVAKIFSSISDSKGFSRNTLIEAAIDKFLTDSEEYLLETQGIDIPALIEESRSQKFDTVILSSIGRGFEETFLGRAGTFLLVSLPDQRQPGTASEVHCHLPGPASLCHYPLRKD